MYTLLILPEFDMVIHPYLFPPTPTPQDAERLPGCVLSGRVASLRSEEWDCLP